MVEWFVAVSLLALAMIGHLAIWAWIFNRTHATACPRFFRKLIEKLILVAVFGPIAWLALSISVPDKWNFPGDLQGIVLKYFDFTGLYLNSKSVPNSAEMTSAKPSLFCQAFADGVHDKYSTRWRKMVWPESSVRPMLAPVILWIGADDDGRTSNFQALGETTLFCSVASRDGVENHRRRRDLIRHVQIVRAPIATVTPSTITTTWKTPVPVGGFSIQTGSVTGMGLAVQVYLYFCCLAACWFSLVWLFRKMTFQSSKRVHRVRTQRDNVATIYPGPLLHGWFPSLLGQIPGNQITEISWEWFELKMDKRWSALDGVKICQLSDFHWTGQIDRRYYEYLFQKVNDEKPDLIFITGDIVDETECLDWIEPLVGILRAKYGVYYVLGNHDLRIPGEADIRSRMTNAGAVAASGNWLGLIIQGQQLWISGNELPWYSQAKKLPAAPPVDGLRILLSHSPDQLDWAQKYDFDLMFAGHLHGGQICFPIIGPTIAPSKYGARFASGFFDLGKLLMIVSRGVSGDEAIRILCPPQVSYFEFKSDDNA